MSIHLVGGGRDEALCAALLAPFVKEAADAAGGDDPVIALLLVLEVDDLTSVDRFRSVLIAAGASGEGVRIESIFEGGRFSSTVVDGAHGIFVGGGLTHAYHDAMDGIAEKVRSRVDAGVPYAGFSAGAAIAASRALVGGYRIGGVLVTPEDTGEELEEVDVRDGLGLVPMTIDVHAGQWGTVSRLIATVGAGLAPTGAAIDEHTALVITPGVEAFAVRGEGHVWSITASPGGIQVSMRPATRST
jgi:cyanophycinase